MRARLNKTAVDEAVYQGPGGCYLWDTVMHGFGLRIYPSGTKSFVVTYWCKGRRRFFTLGQFGRMTVKQARDAALEVFLQVRQGQDPSADRRAAKHSPTMADLARRHLDDHVKIKNKARSLKRAEQLWERCVLPRLGKRRVADIARADIAKLVTDMSDTKAMANKVITQLSKAFNLAEIWGWRPEGTNPCRHVQRYKEESRERYLSESELQRLGIALTKIEAEETAPPQAVAAVRLLILTGCRSAEILGLKWDEVDFETRSLELSDSKTGKRRVVLNTAALQILADLSEARQGPWVIPGRSPGRHLTTLQRLWNLVRVEADIADVRIHDIRHTYASIGVNTGHNLAVVGKLLGHSKILTTQRYAHLADDPLRQANEQIGATLTATMAGRPKAEVVEIGSKG